MALKLTKDSLQSEEQSLQNFLDELDPNDIVNRASIAKRLEVVRTELATMTDELETQGVVILAFDGFPVEGSRGIDAEFAADALHDYQELIAKQIGERETGGLSRTGPVPSRDLARLNITNVVHGSFGFQLEEKDSGQTSLVPSPVKEAITQVDNMLAALASPDPETFDDALASIDRRMFITVQSFYENLYNDSASLKIIESSRSIVLDNSLVARARERLHGTVVNDEDFATKGELLGISPVQRRFDFREEATGRIISGQVDQQLSSQYLARLHGDQIAPGQTYTALMRRRIAVRSDGSERESFTLTGLDTPTDLLSPESRRLPKA
ncbi:hypothetical protein [Sphingomonas sp.]|uniref:hypothetical protein n=1 Tax=Sphingomonas sp. TaxID=28214 RepID=UPI00389FF3C6